MYVLGSVEEAAQVWKLNVDSCTPVQYRQSRRLIGCIVSDCHQDANSFQLVLCAHVHCALQWSHGVGMKSMAVLEPAVTALGIKCMLCFGNIFVDMMLLLLTVQIIVRAYEEKEKEMASENRDLKASLHSLQVIR